MTTTIDKLDQLTTTTHEDDTQEIIKVKKKRGRPRIYTPEEAKERIREYDRRRYYADPEKKIEANRKWRQQLKLK